MHVARSETLEPRRLISGNVTVTAAANFTAAITGDSRSNEIEIRLSAERDGYLIKGRDGTKVNRRRELLLRSPVAAFMNISMGRGDDVIKFIGEFNTQGVNVQTGDGKDRISITGVSHFGNLVIGTGRGDDEVTLADVSITQDLYIDLSRDDDRLQLAAVEVAGDAMLIGGAGDDRLRGTNELAVNGSESISSWKEDRRRD